MKNLFTFYGGVHPPDQKNTSNHPIEEMPIPEKVVIPLIQHTGIPSKPLVSLGDTVLENQKIAEAAGHISVPIHSSVSGKVTDIRAFLHPVIGKPVESIVIECDGKHRVFKPEKTHVDYYRYSPKDLIQVIKDAGIVGLGGAAFPTHVKLSPPKDVIINNIIINGAECEPFLTADDRLMREYSKEVIEGTKIIMYIMDAMKGFVAIEDNKQPAIEIFKKIVFNEPNIDLAVLPTHYPQGAEKQLIKVLLNREVPSGGLPLHVGVVVDNVGTAYSINRAVKEGENLYNRIVTVAGNGIETPKNIKVRVGTLISDIAKFCGGTTKDLAQVIMGGPMMGIAQTSLDVPVLKGTSGILFFTKNDIIDRQYFDCFRCGKCIRVCPMELFPNALSIYIENGRIDEAKAFHPLDCIECGCCAYTCPAQRPIVQQIKWAKTQINKK
ncbi:MAG: electron transport complex subunit RsxC [Endomicrobiales bacterium]|nr:electron transport complex subunit RsxC [Endomicrobiales bacterium]